MIRLIVAADEGETKDQAIARWCVEHPAEDPPGQPDDFLIVHSIVSPKPHRADDGDPHDRSIAPR